MESLSKPAHVPQFVWDGLTEAGQYYLSRSFWLKSKMNEMTEELEALDDAARFELGMRPGRARLVETRRTA